MDLGSILIILALALIVGAVIARPLFEEQGRDRNTKEQKRSVLLAEEEKVLATLQELDMDFAMGKVLAEDYKAQRAALVTEGASVLKAMDEARVASSVDGAATGTTSEKVRLVAAHPAPDEDEIEAEIARRRRPKGSQSGYCGQCGRPVVAGDRFCSHCGASVAVGESPR